jgi:hypothetical protein
VVHMKPTRVVGPLVASCLAMTIRLYLLRFCPFCSSPNYFVCWHHLDPGISLALVGDSLIAKDHRDSLVLILHLGREALRVGSDRGTVPLFFQSSPVPGRVGQRSACSILSSSSLVLNLRRSSKMWIEPLPCLVFVALLIPLPRFPSLPWQVDQRKVNLMFPSLGSIMLKLLYACTFFDCSISVVLAVTTAPLKTLRMS